MRHGQLPSIQVSVQTVCCVLQPPPEEKNPGGVGTANYRADASTSGPLPPLPKKASSMGAAPGVSQTAA